MDRTRGVKGRGDAKHVESGAWQRARSASNWTLERVSRHWELSEQPVFVVQDDAYVVSLEVSQQVSKCDDIATIRRREVGRR